MAKQDKQNQPKHNNKRNYYKVCVTDSNNNKTIFDSPMQVAEFFDLNLLYVYQICKQNKTITRGKLKDFTFSYK